MRCPGCQSENPSGMRFCDKCGASLANRCPKCGFESPPAFDFCGRCGSRLSQPGTTSNSEHSAPVRAEAFQPSIESQNIPEGERKTVTALFADIKGSTDLMEDLDPEDARAIVDPALRLMIEAVHRYEGYIVQ